MYILENVPSIIEEKKWMSLHSELAVLYNVQ